MSETRMRQERTAILVLGLGQQVYWPGQSIIPRKGALLTAAWAFLPM